MGVITGTVYGADGEPASGRIVRIYRRDTGALLTSTVTSTGDSAGPLLDPHWANTSLLMPMDGEDASTVFTDIKGGSISVTGNAKISAAQSVFGGSSAYFDGNGGVVEASSAGAYGFESGALTIECFIRGDISQTNNYPIIIGGGVSWGGGAWMLQLNHASQPGKPSLWSYTKGGAILVGTTDIQDGSWHHIAVTRSGDTWRLFLDGVLDATATFSGALNGATGKLRIGGGGASGDSMKGYIDDLRVTKGVARYLEGFAPPSAPLPVAEYGEPLAAGVYAAEVSYVGEVQRVVLDDDAGDLYNDLIDRIEVA